MTYIRRGGAMQPLSLGSMQAWVHLMRECASLPPIPPLHLQNPHVLFLNRAYASGRSIVTLGQVQPQPGWQFCP